jgi:nucleotide-binding universal stress UspA family protein
MKALDTRAAVREHDPIARLSQGTRFPLHVLVATDGRPQSDHVLLAGRRLNGQGPLEIVCVAAGQGADVDAGDAELIALRRRVGWQLRRVLGEESKTTLDVHLGDAPSRLAAAASLQEDSLLVVGIGRPKVSDRLLGDESTLRLVRAARTPVLAVAPGASLPAHSVMVAVDFSATSFAAARLALRLAAPGAVVLLVHVAPRRGEINWGSAASGFRGDVDLALENWIHQLRRGFSGTLFPVVLHGDPATELLSIAAERACDLVAVGAHGHGPEDRDDIGSITARLVRCANRSIVVTPRCNDVCRRIAIDPVRPARQGST